MKSYSIFVTAVVGKATITMSGRQLEQLVKAGNALDALLRWYRVHANDERLEWTPGMQILVDIEPIQKLMAEIRELPFEYEDGKTTQSKAGHSA